ncbi:DUF5677 domain-containing protein [Legionella pneumophila serogroup 1]|uniref:DUF5677 domain-containing protein n=1 Tax=Legionella pneumophila TaxID=446 RepID=UPI000770B5FF|nr:DUF5677 domain-containing protein [Legionella pneumophila]HAT8822842.1 hypothetical protein [Legionella pneumophila subsp. pneumophila]MCZ4737312.1 DUF5677 domain-containing protein [Legionella pneumophila]MCZ4746131.1 DUF5677 domain-containing protein [Legionella pneumophila]MDI9829171.1 DUF5677 domain-containing protein [Legionella pneumophila]MDO5159264.1 DUF5677 domain-containing protein [Legionella pneumophila]
MMPSPPDNIHDIFDECVKNNSFESIAFEWYKYVAQLVLHCSSLDKSSPAINEIKNMHYAILIGMLNRIGRLMISVMELSKGGNFGETTSILDRCINETCIKLMWLCHSPSEDKFNRFIASSLKSDLKLQKNILSNIKNRGNNCLPIEDRMLKSIKKYINDSGLSKKQIQKLKNIPNMKEMIISLGMHETYYTVIMNIGSHSIHGTWSSLYKDYFELDGESVYPADHTSPTHINQYLSISVLSLTCISYFLKFIINNTDALKGYTEILQSVHNEILKIKQLSD